jgi:nitrate reductase gamma subunit
MSQAGFGLFALYDAARGPLFLAAGAVFVLGFVWRIIRFARLTSAIPPRKRAGTLPGAISGPADADARFLLAGRGPIGRLLLRARRTWRASLFARSPVMAPLSLAFHVLLFVLPLFLPAHNILLFQAFRVALPVLPEAFMDRLTLGILSIGCFFLLRRAFLPRVRALTTGQDLVVLCLVAAPFVSGWLAYHQVYAYRDVLVGHMILGEILIAAIPFTKLGHMPFLLFSRFFMAAEYAWRPADRRWAS